MGLSANAAHAVRMEVAGAYAESFVNNGLEDKRLSARISEKHGATAQQIGALRAYFKIIPQRLFEAVDVMLTDPQKDEFKKILAIRMCPALADVAVIAAKDFSETHGIPEEVVQKVLESSYEEINSFKDRPESRVRNTRSSTPKTHRDFEEKVGRIIIIAQHHLKLHEEAMRADEGDLKTQSGFLNSFRYQADAYNDALRDQLSPLQYDLVIQISELPPISPTHLATMREKKVSEIQKMLELPISLGAVEVLKEKGTGIKYTVNCLLRAAFDLPEIAPNPLSIQEQAIYHEVVDHLNKVTVTGLRLTVDNR